MSDNTHDTTTNGIASDTHGAVHPAEPLDLVTATRTLTEYAIAGRRVAVVSEKPNGVRWVSVGYVVHVNDRICIMSRRRSGHQIEGVRGKPEGESFIHIATITAIIPAKRRSTP